MDEGRLCACAITKHFFHVLSIRETWVLIFNCEIAKVFNRNITKPSLRRKFKESIA